LLDSLLQEIQIIANTYTSKQHNHWCWLASESMNEMQ